MAVKEASLEHLPKPGLLIGDQRVTETSIEYQHVYAATGKPTTMVPLAGAEEVDAAVAAARAALPGWRAVPPSEKRRLMLRIGELITEHIDAIAAITTLDNSIPVTLTANMASVAAELFAYNAGWCERIGGEVVPTSPVPAFDYTLDQPYGVVGVILPWNGPVTNAAMILGPALAAGNCIVVKPPELAPFALLRLGELFLEAGFPSGVVNVVPAGPVGGEALVRHAGVDKVHFTGSGPTAKRILATALETLKPVGLELGGKSACLIFEDADLQAATQLALMTGLQLSGQGCINGQRILVQRSVYEQVVELAGAMMSQLPTGDPQDATSMIGPVVNAAACERLIGVIRTAQQEGARLVTGGERMGGDFSDGYFIAPTLFADVNPSSALARVETFGPVLGITPFGDDDEALRIANATEFGLAGYVHTSNLGRAMRLGAELETGSIWVNGFTGIPASVPFGGFKESGYGRLGGVWGIREFTRTKNVWIGL
jgi:acyl-CoA reductase-like NAD-dependent aldehyde dehydrogenase